MTSPNDEILFTESCNLDDEPSGSVESVSEKDNQTSLYLLEKQGVSILGEVSLPETTEPRDQLSDELLNQGGIEIIHSEE